MINLISVLSFRIATFAAIAKIAAKTVARHSAGWKTIRRPLKHLPSVFVCVLSSFFFFRFQFAFFFPNPRLTLVYNKNVSRGKVFHDRLEFYFKPRFHKIATIAKMDWKIGDRSMETTPILSRGRSPRCKLKTSSYKKVQQRRWKR